jgi:hypothetical protein
MLRVVFPMLSTILFQGWAQTGRTGGAVPLDITINVQPLDSDSGGPGTGAYINARNISSKNIRGYALQVVVTDPVSQVTLRRESPSMSTSYINAVLKVISPGQTVEHPRPVPLPTTQSGATATCKVNIDLVVFDDGTTWVPAKLKSSASLLARIAEKDRNK